MMKHDTDIQTLTAEAVELLKAMVAIPSPSFSESAVCGYISGWMSDKGIVHERIGNNIVAEHIADPSRPTLMLCAHIDTVSPNEGYDFDTYDPDYDVAAAKWGATWRMPKPIEIDELFGNCSQETVEINGKKCTKLISRINECSIIIPCTGWIDGTGNAYYNNYGRYWSSSPSFYGNTQAVSFTNTSSYKNHDARRWGMAIRPVSE